ncbi:LysM peptidoglycan-binding domain-containing protein [Trueperella bernardiae]|uniref:LysM peptidoglycan-binding domain-containing protein n=2 Tax=Bacillati TaxID=1783272 RepID=A0AAW6ZKU6_9ACTO|nr:LysM peptidoglycan-binding domain-containing protein [Micrococcus luteus]MDK8526542.1 LysM peptidoglycan-binding domain-containing protein [Micrococcus luteus]MDK8602355.1 LysM peptidoglycan-binding domain-containing protein [Trueperella bernardiae]
MPTPFLTGLGRVLDTAVGPDNWTGVPGWENRTGYTTRDGRPRGYDDIYGAIIHTTETNDSAFEKAAAGHRAYRDPEAPTLDVVADRWGTRGSHTYALLIARDGTVRLIAAGPGWQAGHGTWPTKVAGPNPGVRDGEANFHTIGISMDANGSAYPVTEPQLVALVKILVQLRKEWAPDRFEVMMHGEWQPVGYPGAEGRTDPTRIPGGWDAIRKAVDAGAWPVKPKPKPAATSSRPAPATGTYTVRPGDTLGRIAKAHATTWQALAKLNALADPHLIEVGQRLRVPAPPTHTVAKGEGLWTIARQHGLTIDQLANLNGLTRTSTIHPGQTLRVA